MSDPANRPDRLADAVRAVAAWRARQPSSSPPRGDLPARIASLERDVKETRTRINALFFTVLTAVVVDLVGRAVLT